MKKQKKIGSLLLDMEVLLDKMVDDHDLQSGDILNLVFSYLMIHRPDAREVYSKDNSNPQFYYGPGPNRKNIKKKLIKLLVRWEGSLMDSRCAEEILNLVLGESNDQNCGSKPKR
jgi:hypothetical protein